MCHTSNEYHVAPGVPCRKTKPLQSQQLTAKALAASSEEEKHGQYQLWQRIIPLLMAEEIINSKYHMGEEGTKSSSHREHQYIYIKLYLKEKSQGHTTRSLEKK